MRTGPEDQGAPHTAAMLGVAALVLALDQLTKWLCVASLPLNSPRPVIPGLLSLTYVRNRGMAFGLLRDIPGPALRWGLVVVSLLAVLLIWMYARRAVDSLAVSLAFGSILGGALGNLVDRLRLGFVVDFIDVHWGPHHWPAFNVADSAITIGGIVLFLALAREHQEAGDTTDDVVVGSGSLPASEHRPDAPPPESA